MSSNPNQASPPLLSRLTLPSNPINNLDWKHRRIEKLNGLAVVFDGCDFSFSEFRDCYFRSAQFKNCNFTGCKFFNCNMKGAQFRLTDLKYATFKECILDSREIITALPKEPNIRRESLQSLLANTTSTGRTQDQQFIVLEEIKAAELHNWYATVGHGSYYQKKYSSFFDRSGAFAALAWSKLNGLIWGHGERPQRIIFSGLFVLALLTLAIVAAPRGEMSFQESGYGVEYLRYSTSFLLDMQTDPDFGGPLWVDYVLATMRYVYVGLYVSVLFRAISHR